MSSRAFGYAFRSRSDTEVPPRRLASVGTAGDSAPLGMFAFAIVDREERAAYFARGPFGIKPLYFAAPFDGAIAADEDGLAELVHRVSPGVRGCIEIDERRRLGPREVRRVCRGIQIAEPRKVKALARLACKTDRVDARVLADIVRRDLVPGVWVSAPRAAGRLLGTGPISKAGPSTLRRRAIEAAQGAWRPTNPWHRLCSETKQRHGKSNPAEAAVACKVLIACWHVHATNPSSAAPRALPPMSRQAPPFFLPPESPRTI
jgi:hypothetical protein